MELWAAIDLLGGSVVTLRQGKESERTSWKDPPLDLAKRWEEEGADGLHIIDLDAAFGKGSNRGTISTIVKGAGIPVQVGGGVRSAEVANALLESGVSRVILGTVAYARPESLKALLRSQGAARLVVAADYDPSGKVMAKGWTSNLEVTVFEAVRRFERAGVENLLATAVGQDGTAKGPDVATMARLAESTKMRLIASGGIRDVTDLKALAKAGASGAVIGRALYDGSIELKAAKVALKKR